MKTSLLVVDDNEDFRTLIEIYAESSDQFEVIGTACDGIEGLDKIIKLKPDVVLLDLIMPNLDGIGVLEKLKQSKLEKEPKIFILSAIGNDMLVNKGLSYDVEFYFVKPVDITYIFERIKIMINDNNVTINKKNNVDNIVSFESIQNQGEKELQIEISSQLYEAGIPPHMLGYRYLREAIVYAINRNTPFTSITKELYPAIAKLFDTTPQKIERGIRNCIEKAWLRSSQDSMDSLLGYTSNNVKSKPTNSEFIAMITEKVRICYKKN